MMTIMDPATAASRGKARQVATMPWLLRRVSQRYRSATANRLAAAGFTDLPQRGYWAITALAGGARDASQLVSRMGVSKQAVSKVVDVVVASGFVDRQTDAVDRRRTVLQLTAKGRKAVAVIEQAVRATEREFATELGAGPLQDLRQMLTHLAGTGT
jgi:DNA-binding MarR family transcriptional regulator